MPRLLALLLLLSVTHAVAQSPDEPPPSDGEPEARLWKEPCDLDGKGRGELLRVSGTSAGGNMSQGLETWRVHLGLSPLVELTQEGRPQSGTKATIAEADRWTVVCSRGAMRLRAGDAELKLSVSGGAARVDPKWLAALAPDRARDLTLAKLEGISALLDGLADEPAVAGADEASARVGLLIAERAIDAGDTDRAEAALQQVEPGKLPALAAWSKKVTARLDALRGATPIRPANPVKLGSVARPVTIPVGRAGEGELSREPDVFWSGASLCVREGERAGTMRCWESAARKWREPEPYASPYAPGPKLKAKFLGGEGGYATRLTLEDAAGERVVGEFQTPSLLARDARGGLVIHSAGQVSREKGDVSVHGYDAATGVGSVLAGAGKYFFDGPTALRSVAQAGRSWSLPAPGKETGVACVSEPLTSPDEQRAACLAAKGGEAAAPADLELWVFELAEEGAGK